MIPRLRYVFHSSSLCFSHYLINLETDRVERKQKGYYRNIRRQPLEKCWIELLAFNIFVTLSQIRS